jgi:hypothetical protein
VAEEPAVLDTSFWTVGHRADVLPYLFDYFSIHAPPAVRDEILAADPTHPRRVYGYAALFRLLEEQGLLLVEEPAAPQLRFGLGEAAALALAGERQWRLLINDWRPMLSATQREIRVVSVPSFIFLLYEREVISLAGAQRKLDLIAANTSPAVIRPIRRILRRLARRRGERQQ